MTGLRLIIAYKLGKGALQLVLAGLLLGAIEAGVAFTWLHEAVAFARQHFASATSVRVAGLLLAMATPRRLGLTALALALDGALTTVEGVALQRRRWCGRPAGRNACGPAPDRTYRNHEDRPPTEAHNTL